MSGPTPSPAVLRLPAGLLRLWPGVVDERWQEALARFQARISNWPGIHRLAPDLFAALPVAGDPDVLDAAAACARLLLGELTALGSGRSAGLRLLVLPGWVEVGEGWTRLVPEDLTRELDRHPPRIEEGAVHLTGHVASNLEGAWELEPAPAYERSSGKPIPIFRLGSRAPSLTPWRNHEIWGRELAWLPRPEVKDALNEHVDRAAFRVTGLLGSGKTRSVLQAFAAREVPTIAVGATPLRTASPPLELRLLERLLALAPGVEKNLRQRIAARLRRPGAGPAGSQSEATAGLVAEVAARLRRGGSPGLAVVLDDLERARPPEWALAGALTTAAAGDAPFQVALVGRSPTSWPRPLAGLPEVTLPPLEAAACARYIDHLLPSLGLPPTVLERFLTAAAGNPFILEEGLIELIRKRLIRRYFGTFVFAGTEHTAFVASARLTRHVEAEVQRLGWSFPLRVLALAGEGVPANELLAAAQSVGKDGAAGWERPYLQAGWLAPVASPWGSAVELSHEGVRAALRQTVAPAYHDELCRVLGELLSVLGGGEALWRTYRLLAGSPEAIPTLLQIAESDDRRAHGAALVDALLAELKEHRTRGGDEATEIEILWRLLPLARRVGRLEELVSELDRAIDLTTGEPRRLLGFSALKVEIDQREGHYEEAEGTLRKALECATDIEEPQKALLLVQLGRILIRQERYKEATELFDRLLPTLEGMGLRSLAASCHFYLGNVALAEHKLELALDRHRRALAERRKLRTLKPLSASLSALGAVTLAMGRYPEALAYYSKAEKVARQSGDDIEVAFALMGVGRTLSRLGDFAGASAPLRNCLALRQGRGDAEGEAVARLAVAENFLHLGKTKEALDEARLAVFRLSMLDSKGPLGDAEQILGRIHLQLRQHEEARGHFLAALEHHLAQGDLRAIAFDRADLIDVAIARERPAELEPVLEELGDYLTTTHYPDLAERLDFRVYRGLDWLGRPVTGVRESSYYLDRAYEALMRKTGYLAPEMRNRFLFQIPDNQAILGAATRAGLAL